MNEREQVVARYMFAILATMLALLVRGAFIPVLHDKQPFLFATLAVVVSAIYLGLWPALLCLALSLCLTVPIIISPTHSLQLEVDAVVGVISYAFANTVICVLAFRQRKATELANANATEVSRLNEELEERVKQRTSELQEANTELAGFTYSIAHDMRQYLRGINVATHMIIEDQSEQLDQDGQISLQSLGRNARQASELVDGLLEFSRLGKNELQKTRVDLSALAHQIAFRLQRGEKETSIRFEIQDGLTTYADRNVLDVALQNLLENAVKYRAPEGEPHIEVGSLTQNDETVFFVKDNGIGFDMRFVDHIFLPFERLVRSVEYPGTGIGLANVRRIVEKHGGRILARSKPGAGATF